MPLSRPQGVAIVGIYPCGKARKPDRSGAPPRFGSDGPFSLSLDAPGPDRNASTAARKSESGGFRIAPCRVPGPGGCGNCRWCGLEDSTTTPWKSLRLYHSSHSLDDYLAKMRIPDHPEH